MWFSSTTFVNMIQGMIRSLPITTLTTSLHKTKLNYFLRSVKCVFYCKRNLAQILYTLTCKGVSSLFISYLILTVPGLVSSKITLVLFITDWIDYYRMWISLPSKKNEMDAENWEYQRNCSKGCSWNRISVFWKWRRGKTKFKGLS